MHKLRYKNILILFFLVFALFGCVSGLSVVPRDEFYIDYSVARYAAELPSNQWKQIDSSRDLDVYTHYLIQVYLKKDTGSIFLVRAGRKIEYGIPSEYDLTDEQLVYLTKMVPKGDFMKKNDLESENPLLERVKKIYKFSVNHPKLGPGQLHTILIKRGEYIMVELFVPDALAEVDGADFYKFLDSLKERKRE